MYITPETIIVYMARDNDGGSGVASMFRKIVGMDPDFTPAYPMSITRLGSAELEYYSVDRAGNQEAVKTAYLFVDNAAPVIASFTAVPSVFMPHAPRAVVATRTMNFVAKATDDVSSLQATLDIAEGDTFSETNIVKTLTTSLISGVETKVPWDGKDKNGAIVPTGVYTVRLTVTDGLNGGTVNHTATSEAKVTVTEWFNGDALDPNSSGAQMYPEISGTRVVWQDQRNGNWDIYTKDISGGNSMAITNNLSDQMRPSISGNIIVWQDQRNGNWDIYGYDLSTDREFAICTDPGNQERPVISEDWVSWQDDSAGNWDIYAYNITTQEKIRITSHERDQIHPAISGNTLTWEDYRHGLGEIYKYDLTARTESRYTFNIYNQTLPAIAGNTTIVWTDQRNEQRDIYFSTPSTSETRVTYGTGDHSQATVLNDLIVYTDYEAGQDDPNLAFFDIKSGIGDKLTANPARQEEPALGTGILAWQDDRDGIYQIYWTNFQVEALPIQVEIKPGFNLVAIGDRLTRLYPKISDLIAANPNDLGINKVITYDSSNGTFVESSSTADMTMLKGTSIGVYATGSGILEVADSGETAQYTLLPGTNYIGMLTVPSGYTGYSLLQSIGFDNVQSVRRFNNQTGAWETAAVRDTTTGKETVGMNFAVQQGDGLIITMKNKVEGWQP